MKPPKIKTWIFWRWKKRPIGPPTVNKSYVQGTALNGRLLELHDTEFTTEYPTRVMLKEIEVIS